MSDTIELPPAKRAKIEDDAQNSQDSQNYGLHVTSEEVEKLREFQVLDEVKSDDEDSNDEGSDKTNSSDELASEEIEKMLEEDLPEGFKGAPKLKEKKYVKRQKTILEEKGINYFEVLPLDWMMVRHSSGMPIYMHRASRVCTLSKPYFLGKGNTRRHDIPISAIPCLAYRIALKEEQKQMEIDRQIAEQIKNGTWADPKQHAQNKDTENSENHVSNKEVNDINMVDVSQNDNSQCPELVSQNSDCAQEILVNGTDTPKCPFNKNLSKQKHYGETTVESAGVSLQIDHTHDSHEKNIDTNNVTGSLLPRDENSQNSQTASDPRDENEQNSQNAQVPADETSQNAKESTDSPTGVVARPVVLPGGLVMPPPRVESVSSSWKAQQLNAEELNDYCKRLFKFKKVQIMHFQRWADRRKYTKARKTMQYPTLPEGTKLITIPAQDSGNENGGKTAKRDWVMNMNGCSYLSVFHEYVRRALHKQPVYEFKPLENSTAPYQATVYIGGMQYGVGHGSSKRQAKSQAARASIHILIPEMRDELPTSPADLKLCKDDPDFTFFDYVTIEDPRIQEFCGAAAEPSPHAILRTCLLRNFGAGDRHIHTEMKKLEFQKIELTMKVGKHSATVTCKNKKQAKQRASQAILQQLHPHITSWGSLLRLYGSRSMKSCKEKKLEEQQITLLQDKARHNEPNHAVLEKLRNEMRKLKERDGAVVPIGTLLVSEDLPSHSGSNLNNVDL